MIRDSSKQPHERLEVWADAMALVEHVYRITSRFPDTERFGLTSQMRRCAVSVPSNIAEGSARRSRIELLRFLAIARGSLAELDTQLQISARLELHDNLGETAQLLDRTFAKLNALIRTLEVKGIAPSAPDESPITNHQSRQPHAR